MGWLLGVKETPITSHSIPLCHVVPDTSDIGLGPLPQPCVITRIFPTSSLAGQARSRIICQHRAPIPTWQPLARRGVEDAPERETALSVPTRCAQITPACFTYSGSLPTPGGF